MNGRVLTLSAPDKDAFAPYGEFILPPDTPNERRFYSDHLSVHPDLSAPVFHMNHVLPSQCPIRVDKIERHPHAAQCFMPLDVSRYVVMVMPSDASGAPLLDQAMAFEVPGTIGVIFRPNTWHLGATVLDRAGHFAVLMWRGGNQEDDEFRTIPALTLLAANSAAPAALRQVQKT